jgi:hypothetical protein
MELNSLSVGVSAPAYAANWCINIGLYTRGLDDSQRGRERERERERECVCVFATHAHIGWSFDKQLYKKCLGPSVLFHTSKSLQWTASHSRKSAAKGFVDPA